MGKKRKKSTRKYGMSWEEIQEYNSVIVAIATKYSGNKALKEDVIQEAKLQLHADKNLDISKFNPNKKDAAIRNTIRNKIIKILKSKKIGRWPFDSLDQLMDAGVQIDSNRNIVFPPSNSPHTLYTSPEDQ